MMSWEDDPCLQDRTLFQVAPVSLSLVASWPSKLGSDHDLLYLALTESPTLRLIVNPPVLPAEIRETTIANTQVCSRI